MHFVPQNAVFSSFISPARFLNGILMEIHGNESGKEDDGAI
jgi:hypothetical protein